MFRQKPPSLSEARAGTVVRRVLSALMLYVERNVQNYDDDVQDSICVFVMDEEMLTSG